jgi:hypothetical protein
LKNLVLKKPFHKQLYAMGKARCLRHKVITADADINILSLLTRERQNRNPASQKNRNYFWMFSVPHQKIENTCNWQHTSRGKKNQKAENAPPYMKDVMKIIKAISQLTAGEIRLIKTIIDDRVLMEVNM